MSTPVKFPQIYIETGYTFNPVQENSRRGCRRGDCKIGASNEKSEGVLRRE